MKNKKGFTLIELLAVIAVIALISMIAIPNIVNLSDGIRKDNMLDDAKRLISMAKYQVGKNYNIRNFSDTSKCSSNSCKLDVNFIDVNKEIVNDPDGGTYKRAQSYVKYKRDPNTKQISYCVVLVGSKRHIGTDPNDCKNEDKLHARGNVVDN